MYLMYSDSADTTDGIKYVTSTGTSTDTKTAIRTGSTLGSGLDGNFTVELDGDDITSNLSTLPSGQTSEVLTNSPFATEYNYFYYIEITKIDGDGAGDDDIVRVIRGKAAVRV